jgi:membrane protein implicated in regulation of membrane protease activity
MVEIRVVVPDAAEADGLLARRAALFDRLGALRRRDTQLSVDGTRNGVRICSEWESRSIVAVIDAVQSWLAVDGVDAASHDATSGCLRSVAGTAALVGQKALVLQQVDPGGRVKIGGEEWSALAFLEGKALQAGEQVEVAQIEGATALVLR